MKQEKKIYFASFQKRIAANAVDFSLLALTLIFVVFLVPATFRSLYGILLYLYLIGVPILYRGQTLGKILSKTKVVKIDTYEDITVSQVQLRELYKYGFIILAFICSYLTSINVLEHVFNILGNISTFLALLFFVIDGYMIIEKFDKRGIHDKLAKTIVIDLNYQFDQSIIHDEYEETYFFKTKK